ncbi:hypothetical protein [Kineosporia babensis]|uniref:Uncharacterized protein n=1 Tax=Kineosporia babensis TaxID=499548 RepID=A0A9X1NB99_9ACTN|nr:hypothetical protein [Kineosporia babensis]MCD5310940.1 hypothetical protein [Kineosporia babensis]
MTTETLPATDPALIAQVVRDARKQLDRARAWKVNPDFAERQWRIENPGLSDLLDRYEGIEL